MRDLKFTCENIMLGAKKFHAHLTVIDLSKYWALQAPKDPAQEL